MALTILQRPEGYILDGTEVTAVSFDSSGDFGITKSGHGLVTDDVIYVVSTIDTYNGFKKVGAFSATQIQVLNLDGSTIDFLQVVSLSYYQNILTHGWSCVHLPITYKISNTLYPTNSADTARTITTLTNNNGFAQLGLSGTLGTFEDLSFVKISNAPNSDLDGVWQIIDKISTTSIMLNLEYDSINEASILGSTIQLYYNSYNVVIQVYAGINASHQWTLQKPYELAATLELIPDENNEVFFSINDILKAYVRTENNLLLGTLPNNIDAWTNFYISIAEQYDSSNGYTVGTTLSSFTSDLSNFEGTAVNAMLEFKNIHSGSLSEYLMTNTAAKFLTLFSIPVLFSCSDDTPDCYQDISFLNNDPIFQVTTLRQVYYSDGSQTTTTDIAIEDLDAGVYRIPLSETGCSNDRVDISLIGTEVFENPTMDSNIDGWTSEDGYDGSLTDYPWVYNAPQQGARNQMDFLDDSEANSNGLSHNYNKINETNTRSFNYIIRWDNSGINVGTVNEIHFFIDYYLNGGLVGTETIDTDVALSPNTNIVGAYSTLNISWDEFRLRWKVIPNAGAFEAQINFYVKEFTPTLQTGTISETKQFDIDCGCAEQEIRLTWINNLGGFDYWNFTAQSEHAIDITQSTETKKNIFPQWPDSYGAFSDTIRKQTSRTSVVKKFLVSQNVTQDQADAIAFIKSSPLVQIINSRQDRRTVLVDTDSFVKYVDGDKLFTISFNITYTDDIPSQKV